MKIYKEEQLLDIDYRKTLIEEVEGEENLKRKSESYKRYEIYRDRIKKYILQNLILELDPDTVNEMQSRVATINIYKKMVQKKARVYKDIPKRTSLEENKQDYINSLVDLLSVNTVMKKVNRYVEAFRNCAVYNKPYKDFSKDGRWSQMLDVLAPHQFDVIEDMDNPSIARAVILSHYDSSNMPESYYNPGSRNKTGTANNFRDGDGRNQNIADSPADKNENEYIFWSNNYHFTCNGKGEIISDDINNPIGDLPFTFFSKDQDGSFWSVGGEDIIEGSILINTLLTDLYFIAKIQGMGLFYLFGANVPKTYKVGPNKAVTMKVEEGDPTPQIGFANSNPPISDHMGMIEQNIALLLSTNDLGTNSIQGKLDGQNAASGIQEIIQNAEPMTAIEDEQQQYKYKEQEVLRKANRWQEVLSSSESGLTYGFSDIGYVDDLMYLLEFERPQHFSNEAERLSALKSKMDMGILNKVDIMIEENPDLTREEALQILLEKSNENMKIAASSLSQMITGDTEQDEQLQEDSEDQEAES